MSNSEVDALKAKLAAAEREINNLKDQLATAFEEIDMKSGELEAIKGELARTQHDLHSLEEDAAENKRKNLEFANRIQKDADAKVTDLRARFTKKAEQIKLYNHQYVI